METKLNMYLIVSEVLTHYPSGCGIEPPLDPPEQYQIACLVVAKNHSQAKWLAWKSDSSFEGDPREMPKMSCNLRFKDFPASKPFVMDPEISGLDQYWYDGRYCGQDGLMEEF